MRFDQALELEILNECLHNVESCIFEAAAPNAEGLALNPFPKYQLDISTDAEANTLRVGMLNIST